MAKEEGKLKTSNEKTSNAINISINKTTEQKRHLPSPWTARARRDFSKIRAEQSPNFRVSNIEQQENLQISS